MKALITGVAGQDGSYLAEFLLEKGYEVYGLKLSTENLQNIAHLKSQIKLLDGDLNNTADVFRAVQTSMPDEIYNLAGMSYVGNSWDFASLVRETNFFGVQRLLHAVQMLNPSAKVYQASSCEMFGGVDVFPQSELTVFKPVSPYAESKLEAHLLMQSMRKQMFTSCGILFNHESPRRGMQFVTRKISDGVARIASGRDFVLKLGNLNAEKDWGFAGDYVRSMWLILRHNQPDDFVIGTGEKHSVRDFVNEAFAVVGKKLEWVGSGLNEKGFIDGKLAVEVDPSLFRKQDTKPLVADCSKAKRLLGWKPEVSFRQLVEIMVKADLKRVS